MEKAEPVLGAMGYRIARLPRIPKLSPNLASHRPQCTEAKATAYVLESTLPTDKLPQPTEEEGARLGLLSVVLTLIMLNGRPLTKGQLCIFDSSYCFTGSTDQLWPRLAVFGVERGKSHPALGDVAHVVNYTFVRQGSVLAVAAFFFLTTRFIKGTSCVMLRSQNRETTLNTSVGVLSLCCCLSTRNIGNSGRG